MIVSRFRSEPSMRGFFPAAAGSSWDPRDRRFRHGQRNPTPSKAPGSCSCSTHPDRINSHWPGWRCPASAWMRAALGGLPPPAPPSAAAPASPRSFHLNITFDSVVGPTSARYTEGGCHQSTTNIARDCRDRAPGVFPCEEARTCLVHEDGRMGAWTKPVRDITAVRILSCTLLVTDGWGSK